MILHINWFSHDKCGKTLKVSVEFRYRLSRSALTAAQWAKCATATYAQRQLARAATEGRPAPSDAWKLDCAGSLQNPPVNHLLTFVS